MEQNAFDPADPKAALAQLPQSAAVFALYGAEAHAEPYIGRTPNLRARLARLLQPSPKHPRRLQLPMSDLPRLFRLVLRLSHLSQLPHLRWKPRPTPPQSKVAGLAVGGAAIGGGVVAAAPALRSS